MIFRRYKLLVCRKSETNAGVRPSRLVFSGHGPSVPPSREELIEQEVREGVQLEKTQIEGYYLTNPPNPVIETGRLGVRTEIAATLHKQGLTDTKIQEGIINERVNAQLRTLVAHHVAEQHQQQGWIEQKLHSIKDTMSDMGNPFRAVGRFFGNLRGGNPNSIKYNTAAERHLEDEMNKLFGGDKNPDVIVDHIVDSLDDAMLDSAVPVLRVGALTPPTTARSDLKTWLKTSDVSVLQASFDNARTVSSAFFHKYELLLNVRKIHARERSKILSIELYDPTRLRKFLDDMKKAPSTTKGPVCFALINDQILEKGSLDNLDSSASTQALIAHMMYLYESSTPPDWDTLHRHLDEIKKALPATKADATVPDAEKPENIKLTEKIDEQYKNLKKAVIEVTKKYREAKVNSRRLSSLQNQANGFTNPPRTLNKFESDTLREINKEIRDLEASRSELFSKTNDAEQEYKDVTGQLVKTLLDSQKQSAPSTGTPLDLINIGAGNSLSQEHELFSATNAFSGLQKHIESLDKKSFDDLTNQINTDYKSNLKSHERISARHLLVSLKEKRMQDNGVLDEGRRLKMAIFSANLMIADVKSVDLYRAGNREIAETMVTGWAGWRRRASQSIASKYFNSNTFTARDIIDHVAEVDVDKKFQFLKDLNPESSLADLRHHLHEHHVHIDDLAAARTHLQKVLEGLQVGHHDRVEIADTSWTIENLVHNLLVLETELESRAFFDEVQNPVNPEDKKLHKGAYLKKLWAQTYESDQKRQEAVAAKLQNFPNTLKKYLMKGTWGKQYEEGLKEAKAKGFSGEALKEYLQNEKKIPGAVLKHLMTGLAVKEAYDIGKGTIGWIGSKLGKGVKGVAKFGAEKGGSVLSSAWDRLGKPALYASGRGLKKAGKFALWDVPKFALWTTPKFFMWDAPVWTVKKATKAAVWPFKMAGRALSGFWNFFHYTPEKAARDKAWYDAKKAASGGHGGHGDGHGGGHGGHGGH